MSGHSKWSQIKHKKGISDQKRSQIFSKLAKLITLAAKDGLDPKTNFKLRAAIENAKSFNLPNDNIEKAIRKSAEKGAIMPEEVRVEILGPGGVAIIIQAISDNKNRTVSEIKNIVAKNESKVVAEGSLMWIFKKIGSILVKGNISDSIQLLIIESGALDIKNENGNTRIISEPEGLEKLKIVLSNKNIEILESSLDYLPKQLVKLNSGDEAKFEKLVEAIDNYDDIQDIYSNKE